MKTLSIRVRGTGKHNIGKLFYTSHFYRQTVDVTPTYDPETTWGYGYESFDKFFRKLIPCSV